MVKIENILTGNEFNKLFYTYIILLNNITEHRDEKNSKLSYFLVHHENYKLKQLIISEFYKLSKEHQKTFLKEIFKMNEVDIETLIMEIIEILRSNSCFNNFILMRIFIY